MNGEPIHVIARRPRSTRAFVLHAELNDWLDGPYAAAFLELLTGARRDRGFGDFWGHMLVARGLGRRDARARARDLGLGGAVGDRRGGRRSRSRTSRATRRSHGASRAHHERRRCTTSSSRAYRRCARGRAPALELDRLAASPARSSTTFAAATSWTPTPVRSHTIVLIGTRPPGLRARADLAELGRVVGREHDLGVERVVELADPRALVPAVDDQEVGERAARRRRAPACRRRRARARSRALPASTTRRARAARDWRCR